MTLKQLQSVYKFKTGKWVSPRYMYDKQRFIDTLNKIK
jgi:hypothetical protein